jgi:hypothetical protein
LDNLIRRELKVGDPNDPAQVAQALLVRYQDDPRARAISQEAQGLPFLQTVPVPAQMTPAPTSSDNELALATADVEKGISDLTTNPLLKDITPELQGWADAIRSAIAAGTTAARFALDARQRDKAFAMRRTLGDYARMARLVGALTPGMNPNYRAFAQSIDEAAAVILVMTGDALSSVGLNRGQFLLQAPYTELQTRRDAAIYALRNLIGATQQAYGPDNWPRGLDAYRRLFDVLENQGQGALRSLLVETELARTMDALIQRAANGSADGLRALGSTAQLDLEQFRRLVIIGRRAVIPPEPPLTAFLEALLLFVEAFDSAGGFRLVRIARPPVLFYGLYGNAFTNADNTLLQLIIQRGQLADQLDCLMSCDCSPTTMQRQIILDKILYDVDRAIDLYAVGKNEFGAPERRAAAYSYLIEYFSFNLPQPPFPVPPFALPLRLQSVLTNVQSALRPPLDLGNDEVVRVVQQLLYLGLHVNPPVQPPAGNWPATVYDLTTLLFAILQQQPALAIPGAINEFLGIIRQELVAQRETEERWRLLVETMAADCLPSGVVFDSVTSMIRGAIQTYIGGEAEDIGLRIPAQFETSLDALINDRPDLNRRG